MAYIHKMTIYFVDPDEETTPSDIESLINNDDWLPHAHTVKAETKTFPWDDEVIVNKCAATATDYETFFNNLS